jgi:hypothetical protein
MHIQKNYLYAKRQVYTVHLQESTGRGDIPLSAIKLPRGDVACNLLLREVSYAYSKELTLCKKVVTCCTFTGEHWERGYPPVSHKVAPRRCGLLPVTERGFICIFKRINFMQKGRYILYIYRRAMGEGISPCQP